MYDMDLKTCVCRLYDDDTYSIIGYDARQYRRIKRHEYPLVVNK